jgi:hypothetical protein
MRWSRYRRAAGVYLVLFFLAVTAAPHHHLNGLEDLLLDQRSDSGILVQTVGPVETGGPAGMNPYRLVQDVPCLACFTRDFVCAPAAAFFLFASFSPLPLAPPPPDSATPELIPADPLSRAPPRIS